MNDNFHIDPAMRFPLIVSAILHIGIVAFAYFGLPYVATPEPIVLNSATVEIITVEEETKTDRPPARKVMPKNDTPAPLSKPAPPKMEAQQPPKLTAPEPPKLAEDISKPVTPAIPPPQPREKKKPEPAPPKKDAPKKPDAAAQQQEFSSLLRNLTPHAPTQSQNAPQTIDATQQSQEASPVARFAQQVSMSEMDALRQQLAGCWAIPAGAKYAENLVVEVRIFVNSDRTVRDTHILDTVRYSRDAAFAAAADSAVRAVRSPRCNPLNLPPDKYDQWKTIVVRFDPREMLQ
ncbi:MAG: hypothetical protein EOM26_07895 [Alphaproteobacteria bacterium]|nr:hypothetical protein [Alphaproteobacteria bacterium]